eukprot:Skav222781  [mRNA]  locus=scaffold600:507882:508278:- [translate_table: standard]
MNRRSKRRRRSRKIEDEEEEHEEEEEGNVENEEEEEECDVSSVGRSAKRRGQGDSLAALPVLARETEV